MATAEEIVGNAINEIADGSYTNTHYAFAVTAVQFALDHGFGE
jgi:hypothetical protein